MSEDEQALLHAVARGDQSAFEALFRIYHPRVHKFVGRLLSDHLLVDEATCDTLYAVWQGATRFQGQSRVSTWIFGIAYRQAMKSLDKHSRYSSRIEPDIDSDALTDTGSANNPATWTEHTVEGERLTQALQTLSTEQRVVMELVALGHSCAEIAAIVECPENTVKTRTFHARRKLRAQLQADES